MEKFGESLRMMVRLLNLRLLYPFREIDIKYTVY